MIPDSGIGSGSAGIEGVSDSAGADGISGSGSESISGSEVAVLLKALKAITGSVGADGVTGISRWFLGY